MPLPPVSQFLVDHLHALPLLDGRFESPRIVNFNSVADTRRGVLSLVFRARDIDSGKDVALKFFDPSRTNDVYRLNAFNREHEILKGLIGFNRCLQVCSGINEYQLPVPSGGVIFPFPCRYFAVEWIENEVDAYFLKHGAYTADKRLELLEEIACSIAALHSRGVFHRDLKHDNLRSKSASGRPDIVVIDMGTAAAAESAPIKNAYDHPAGAPAYAAPEALCGLAGNRLIAKSTDLYSLGCMLYELFNPDYFFREIGTKNLNYHVLLDVMRMSVDLSGSERQQLTDWHAALGKMAKSVVPAQLDGPGSDVPPGIAPLLNEVLQGLTNCDYRCRPTLAWVRRRIASARKVLQHEALYQRHLKMVRAQRQRRLDKLRAREARLALAMAKRIKVQ